MALSIEGGILVSKEVLVATSSSPNLPENTFSSTIIQSTNPFPKPKDTISASWDRRRSSVSILSSQLRNPELAEESPKIRQARLPKFDDRDAHGSDDLIEILRSKTPPPGNYMSIPEYPTERQSRWARFRKLRRRSRSAPNPIPIRLPDSAVAGTTIGGHRHIAISIPLQYTYFDHDLPSKSPPPQLPALLPREPCKTTHTSRGHVRTFVNDKGMVAVLRPVQEDGESQLSSAHSFVARPPLSFPLGIRGANLPISPPQSRKGSANEEYRQSHHSSIQPPLGYGQITPGEDRLRFSGETSLNGYIPRLPPRSPSRPVYPVRKSSARNGINPDISASMNGLMANSLGNPNGPFSNTPISYNQPHRTSVMSEQSAVGSFGSFGTEAVYADAQTARRYTSGPVVIQETRSRRQSSATELSIADHPQTSSSPPGESALPPSRDVIVEEVVTDHRKRRRERVRERVKRDMGASKTVKDNQSNITSDATVAEPSCSPGDSKKNITDSTSAHMTSPDFASCSQSSDPTPPQSLRGLSPRESIPFDRTSLSRRREWRTELEHSHERREMGDTFAYRQIKIAMEAASAAEQSERRMRKKIDAIHDVRIRDLERRMRRLERNSDLYMRALLPILASLNQTLLNTNPPRLDRPRTAPPAWAEEEGESSTNKPSSSPPLRGRSAGAGQEHRIPAPTPTAKPRTAPGKRSPVVKKYVLGDAHEREIARLEDELDEKFNTWASRLVASFSEDEGESVKSLNGGMEALEPLMRELQGASRLSLESSGEQSPPLAQNTSFARL
jgi:hypothetical protein